jgi:hypothetical protein
MPGARHPNFRLGDRTELLAEFCLNTIAFSTRVPRQEDIGHDFFCVLSEVRQGLLWAGPSFTVQVKSDANQLVFEKEHEIKWIKDIENPFFLVVGHRNDLRIDIYSTWARMNGFLRKSANRIILKPGPPKEGLGQVWTNEDGKEQIISLGHPVISATLQELMDEGRADTLREILKQWILLDRENIVNILAGMYWVVGPRNYRTNEPFLPETELKMWIYWNAKNLDKCQVVFGRAAAALRLTLLNALGPNAEKDPEFTERIQTLNAALISHRNVLEPTTYRAIRKYIEIDL